MKACVVSLAIVLVAFSLPRRTSATHQLIGEPPRFPAQQTSNIYTYETDVNGDRNNLIIPCDITNKSSVVSYTWFRGDQPIPAEMVDASGNLLVVNITEGEYASRSGVNYYCVATKMIGKNNYAASVRSRTITVFYAFFNGFEPRDEFISVAMASNVAMECAVLKAKPTPQIEWLRNGATITEDKTSNTVRFLDGGLYLFLSSVDSSDLEDTFTCRVTNALLDRVMTAPTTYRLLDNITREVLVEYKPIGNVTAFVSDTIVEFAYVGGSFTSIANGTFISPRINNSAVRINLQNIAALDHTPDDQIVIGKSTLSITVSYHVGSAVREGCLTVYQRPTITNGPTDNRELVVGMNNLMYTCEFEGSPTPTIEWYFNGQPISPTSGVSTVGNTLTIASPQVSNSGIYQCIVSSPYGDDQRAWLLEIREPIETQVLPYNFTALDAFDDRDLGALFVRNNASTVTFSVDVVSDPCPDIQWYFNGKTIGPSNTSFVYNNPCESTDQLSPNWTFTLDVVLTAETSGPYTANFTNRAGTVPLPNAYITVPENFAITDLTLSEPCLKSGMNVSLRCAVSGFPRPSISFQFNGSTITPGVGIYENFVVQQYYDQILILNVNNTAQGMYTCTATGGTQTPMTDNQQFQFCTVPSIVSSESTPNPKIGEELTISCSFEGIPQPSFRWTFRGEPLEESDGLSLSTRSGGFTTVVEVPVASADFAGLYECIISNPAGEDSRSFLIELQSVQTLPLPLGAIIGIAAGGVAIILLIAFVILLLICVYTCAKKSTSGNYSANPAYMGTDYHDGRGNVDKDSDEEEGQPEAFNPQYESLPALRPSQPPSYKPTPSYPMGGDDMEMRKVPLPDSDSYLGGGYMMQDNGTAPYNRPVVDDFLSEDAQFV